VNLVFHGHSVPAGYFKTPHVDTLNAYPAQLQRLLKERFPTVVLNSIVTAIGGEDSVRGAARFAAMCSHCGPMSCASTTRSTTGASGSPRRAPRGFR
jgi:hypothetical protein